MPSPTSLRLVPLAAVLVACVDYNLGADKPADGSEGETGDSAADTATDTGETGETADTDTGAPAPCDVVAPAATAVEGDDACAGGQVGVVEEAWKVTVEWEYASTLGGSYVMPAIGNLDDDDGDGDVDADDTPEIAFVEYAGALTVLAADGSVRFTASGYTPFGGVAIADVTGDGVPEIVALDGGHRANALAVDGSVVWKSEALAVSGYPQPTVADLDGDGRAEVIYDTAVLDGVTGALLVDLAVSGNVPWHTPVVADLDQDGTREILVADGVFAPDGTRLWTHAGGGWEAFAVVVDVDGDPEGEVVVVSGTDFVVHDTDGTLLASAVLPDGDPGPPCAADLDGDGEVEVAFPMNVLLYAYELDGTELWEADITDVSGIAGCSAWDVDGDGAYEVLYADEDVFRVLDGRTGAALYEDPRHDSGTLWEYPVVADLDHDGHGEIAVVSNRYLGGRQGLAVYGHEYDAWPPAGPTWAIHDFAVTNIGADGSVPVGEVPSWQAYNVFRARPAADVPPAADLFATLGEVCLTGCGAADEVQVAWQVGNRGVDPSPAGTATLYAVVDGVESALDSVAFGSIPGGEVPAGGVFRLPAGAVAGAGELVLRLHDVGWGECDAADNEARITAGWCP